MPVIFKQLIDQLKEFFIIILMHCINTIYNMIDLGITIIIQLSPDILNDWF